MGTRTKASTLTSTIATPATAAGNGGRKEESVDPAALRELTTRLAYERYEQRGCEHGHDLEDWLASEAIARTRLNGGTGL